MAKKSIWYQRGYDACTFEDWRSGSETCELMARIIGNKHGFMLHRFPKKMAEFKNGYSDRIHHELNEFRAKNGFPPMDCPY